MTPPHPPAGQRPRGRPRLITRADLIDGLAGGAAAAVVSGAPSTLHALLSDTTSPREATLAAGSIALPRQARPLRLAIAAVPVHLTLSLGWGAMLGATLPRSNTVAAGAVAGLAIAALDLGLIGRAFPRIRALATPPQVADHLAYGLTVALVVRYRRNGRETTPRTGSHQGDGLFAAPRHPSW